MLTTVQKVKETFLIGGLNIVLPTSDVYSDGALIYDYYTGYDYHEDCENWNQKDDEIGNGTHWELLSINDTCLAGMPREQLQHESHPWATSLLVPFLLNYFAGWLAWYRRSKQKKISWLACLFNLYPQLTAAQAIREVWRNSTKGIAKMRKLEVEDSQAEIFLEAVPTVFILSHIGNKSYRTFSFSGRIPTRSHQRAAYSENYNTFLLAYLTSMASASLGMAKALKVGVCKVLSDHGLLSGLLTFRFIVLFFACLFTLLSNALFMIFLIDYPIIKEYPVLSSILAFLVPTLPGLVIGLMFIKHRAMLKTFLNHPSLLLLPVFTFFSFESNVQCCGTDKTDSRKEIEISFSVRASICNALVSIALQYGFSTHIPVEKNLNVYLSVISVIPTMIFLCIIRPSCDPSPQEDFSTSSCNPPPERGVYLPSSPDKVFIKDQAESEGRREIIVEA